MSSEISFEFFPPKTVDGIAKLRETRKQLALLNPKFFSVTFGAGGSTRDRTLDTVVEIQSEGFDAAPHISGISSSKEEITQLLEAYKTKGIRRLVVLRGDLPSGEVSAGDFRYANELVAFIRQATGDWFQIEVAAYPEFHPESSSPKADIQHFKSKVDAGADAAITQYFPLDHCLLDRTAGLDRCRIFPLVIPATLWLCGDARYDCALRNDYAQLLDLD